MHTHYVQIIIDEVMDQEQNIITNLVVSTNNVTFLPVVDVVVDKQI